MPGLTDILNIARNALMTQRLAINVTSNNVSNASTPGYSRQRIDFTPAPSLKTSFGLLGTGVSAGNIGRIRERFIDQQLRNNNDSFGSATMQQRILSQVEAAVNEPSDNGVSVALSKFFDVFQQLATRPEDGSTRNSVVQQASILVQNIHRLHSNISTLRNDLLVDVDSKIQEINQLAKDVGTLNGQIISATSGGNDSSDLQDQRDLKIDRLSSLAKVHITAMPSGAMLVSINGNTLVSEVDYNPIKVSTTDGNLQVTSLLGGKNFTLDTGELGGILQQFNVQLPEYQERLNKFSETLINRVNTVHSAGYGLGIPPSTGINFFTGSTADDIAINNQVITDTNKIAASASGKSGDNNVALAISDVRSEKLLQNNSQSLSQFYNSFVSGVGSSIQSAENTINTQKMIITQLEQQRSAVSGVSIDEEMTNLIKYQKAYDAAARMVTTVNEMYDTILRMV